MPNDLPARRAKLRQALERVESRESDGIVVARLKNIGGSLVEAVDTPSPKKNAITPCPASICASSPRSPVRSAHSTAALL